MPNHHRLLLILVTLALSACQWTDAPETTWTHDDTGVFSAAFSGNGQYAIIAPTKGPAKFIEVANNRVIHQWQHSDENDGIVAAAISNNLRYAITAEKNSLSLWRIRDGKILGFWDFPAITDLAISASGAFAMIGMENNKAYYFDLFNGRIVYTFEHQGRINSVALAKDKAIAMTGGAAHKAKLWDLRNGQMIREWDHPFKVYKVLLSNDAALAMTNASMNKARLWETETGNLLGILPMRFMTVTAGQFSADNRYLATGRPNYQVDLWDIKTTTLKQRWAPKKKFFWRPDSAAIIGLAFEANGKSLVSTSSNGQGHRWKIQ